MRDMCRAMLKSERGVCTVEVMVHGSILQAAMQFIYIYIYIYICVCVCVCSAGRLAKAELQ